MFTLMYGFYKFMFQKDDYYILILGLDNAGKSTYLEQTKIKFNKNYKGMNLNKITTTVGLNLGEVSVNGIRLNFWDLGGQEELQSLWDKYYAESHGIIYVVDSSQRDRLEESVSAFEKMVVNETLTGVPLLLLANKQDVDGCMTVSDIKMAFNRVSHKIGKRDLRVMGVSALLGDGVDDGIKWIEECVVRNSGHRPPIPQQIS
ncbi:DgyrCDS1164 [Dimorphilus gyrociliatus]|uniref:ADP-ribosylation factor-related protein 1 n=1 Tax=Dimorphilus gyrociliatus TaxID=2664684 RepID=A0A7I8V7W7_9ANNE|nr:DgyrCDS1164 [Dimorphilus gyrociliatus]